MNILFLYFSTKNQLQEKCFLIDPSRCGRPRRCLGYDYILESVLLIHTLHHVDDNGLQ